MGKIVIYLINFVLCLEFSLVSSGFLSRTGVCPHPSANFVVKDKRLNFYGQSFILPGDESPPCNERECVYDNDCHGDTRCCTNHCGAFVCTETVREPHPCQYFTCPITKICKIQKIKCIEPICPAMLTIARPMCINGGPYYEFTKRARIPHPRKVPEAVTQEKESASYWPYSGWNPFSYLYFPWYKSGYTNWGSYYNNKK